MAGVLDEILNRLDALPKAERDRVIDTIPPAVKALKFIPNPGRQTEAYLSKADILLYGGAASGGKSYLLMGLASQEHQSSIIFRREVSQTDGLERSGKQIFGLSAKFNGSDNQWTWADDRTLRLAGLKEPDDWMKHAGRERDFMGFDEAGEFLETQVASLLPWLRGPTGQRCRIVLASNPPRSEDGYWVTKWFAPWLDDTFHDPAKPGELRWAVGFGSEIAWVSGPEPVDIDGVMQRPLSLTFIPALLADNPYRDTEEYRAKLNATPEPLRSQLLYGDFRAGRKDADYQIIPTAWIVAAQARWTPHPPENMAMTAMAYDPAGGGRDNAELAIRYGGWFAPLISVQGEETADGSASAASIVKHRRDGAAVVVDCDGGYGGSVCMRLADNGIEALKYKGSEASTAKTKDGTLGFANKRSANLWRLREELDPGQEGGSAIALPPDSELRADLASVTWKLTARGIQAEPKQIIGDNGKVVGGLRKKLGRSPGKGDAVVMALAPGDRAVLRNKYKTGGNSPKPILGYAHLKQRR